MLQAAIASFESGSQGHPAVITSITHIIGAAHGNDVINGLFEYLNSPSGPLKMDAAQNKELIESFLEYMNDVKTDAKSILASL